MRRSSARAAVNASVGESQEPRGSDATDSETVPPRSRMWSKIRSAWVRSSSYCTRNQCAKPFRLRAAKCADIAR